MCRAGVDRVYLIGNKEDINPKKTESLCNLRGV